MLCNSVTVSWFANISSLCRDVFVFLLLMKPVILKFFVFQMADVIEREEMEAVKRTYTHTNNEAAKKENSEGKGFVVTDAPWSTSDFPAIGAPPLPSPTGSDTGKVPTWGPRKKVWT